MKSNYVSWRYMLWCFSELKEGEWVAAKDFISLFDIPLPKFYSHIFHLKRYGHVVSRYVKLEEGVKGINENKIKEYQITSKGKFKTEQWRSTGCGFIREKDKISCLNCGFSISVKEFQFINEVVNKK